MSVAVLLSVRPVVITPSPEQQEVVRGADGCRHRLLAAQQGLVQALGRPLAALSILLAGVSAAVAVCWPLGRLARRLQRPVDVPLLRLVQNSNHHPSWTRVTEELTLMGNRPQVKIVCIVTAVVLTVLWRRRGWYIPVIVIATAFGMEKFLQQILGRVVGREHRLVATLGTYPSGGCARVIAIYGAILFLFLLILPPVSRGARIMLWSFLSLAAFMEGYTRIYLLKHWFTDVVGGWIFGALLLAVFIAATATFCSPQPRLGGLDETITFPEGRDRPPMLKDRVRQTGDRLVLGRGGITRR